MSVDAHTSLHDAIHRIGYLTTLDTDREVAAVRACLERGDNVDVSSPVVPRMGDQLTAAEAAGW